MPSCVDCRLNTIGLALTSQSTHLLLIQEKLNFK